MLQVIRRHVAPPAARRLPPWQLLPQDVIRPCARNLKSPITGLDSMVCSSTLTVCLPYVRKSCHDHRALAPPRYRGWLTTMVSVMSGLVQSPGRRNATWARPVMGLAARTTQTDGASNSWSMHIGVITPPLATQQVQLAQHLWLQQERSHQNTFNNAHHNHEWS